MFSLRCLTRPNTYRLFQPTRATIYSLRLSTRATLPSTNIVSTRHAPALRQPRPRRCYSAQSTRKDTPLPLTDPTRPDLFYHLVSPPNPLSAHLPAYALSFLITPPRTPDASAVIGWLPAQSGGEGQEAGLNDFKENPKFREAMHEAIIEGLQEDVDDIQRNGALQLQQGWLHINDERNIPPLNRVGDPDDIIASVLVTDSKIQPNTYSAMPSYRVCTADGVTHLTEGLAAKLKEVLERKARDV